MFAPLVALLAAPELAPAPRAELPGYRRPAELVRADPAAFRAAAPAAPVAGYVGLAVGADSAGRAAVEAVAPGSPAEEAGLRPGDVVVEVAGAAVSGPAPLRERLRAAPPGDELAFTLLRGAERKTAAVRPRPASRPLAEGGSGRAVLGVQTGEPRPAGGVEVVAVTPGGAADKAGVRAGDVLLRVDGVALTPELGIRDVVSRRQAGDVLTLAVGRRGEEVELRATLQTEPAVRAEAVGWDERLPRAWRKPSYRLAVLGIEYPDQKHNPVIPDAAWADSLFSAGTYTGRSATGQRVHGSMADYFREISSGRFKPEGAFLGWVEVGKKRLDYSTGLGTSTREKRALLAEALDKYLAAKGAAALDGYDGVFFVYAGGRVNTTRGGLYWPHRATLRHGGKTWPYFIVQEGGARMTDISVFCHEFGHMLGLPDLYARPEVPGMEGVGPWCAMSQQNGGGRPQHYSAWSKEQLGWVDPVAVDPRVRQKVVLAPVTDGPGEFVKVPLRADGAEYLLLENRARRGFDAELPGEGLLIWRVLPGNAAQRVYLEESHGVGGAGGPRQHLAAVPYPSPANDSFTPWTTPSSRGRLGGALDVYISNVRRHPDGRVTFEIGTEYQ